MELIEKLPTEYINGQPVRKGRYLCPACGKEVVRNRGSAGRTKHCGCLTHEQRARRKRTTTSIIESSAISRERWK